MPLKTKLPTEGEAYRPRLLSDLNEPGCFTGSDSLRSLVLTPRDADTEGFPLTWLYRWHWQTLPTHERLTLTLTEHEVTIQGSNLGPVVEHLTTGKGFHLRVQDDRYHSLLSPKATRITSITIQPHGKNDPSLN